MSHFLFLFIKINNSKEIKFIIEILMFDLMNVFISAIETESDRQIIQFDSIQNWNMEKVDWIDLNPNEHDVVIRLGLWHIHWFFNWLHIHLGFFSTLNFLVMKFPHVHRSPTFTHAKSILISNETKCSYWGKSSIAFHCLFKCIQFLFFLL